VVTCPTYPERKSYETRCCTVCTTLGCNCHTAGKKVTLVKKAGEGRALTPVRPCTCPHNYAGHLFLLSECLAYFHKGLRWDYCSVFTTFRRHCHFRNSSGKNQPQTSIPPPPRFSFHPLFPLSLHFSQLGGWGAPWRPQWGFGVEPPPAKIKSGASQM